MIAKELKPLLHEAVDYAIDELKIVSIEINTGFVKLQTMEGLWVAGHDALDAFFNLRKVVTQAKSRMAEAEARRLPVEEDLDLPELEPQLSVEPESEVFLEDD